MRLKHRSPINTRAIDAVTVERAYTLPVAEQLRKENSID